MWRYIKYLSVIVLAAIASCQKTDLAPDIQFSEGGLISFSTRINTKADIITSLNNQHFGVYGYTFSPLTNWNTAKTEAVPNVFHNLDVSCDSDGACSYSIDTNTDINGREQWILNQRYSFFAHYPVASNSFTLSSNTTVNTPYIDYKLPIKSDGTANPDDMLDIMTAKVTDYNATQGTIVRFEFYHRLFCIDLYGQNFNTSPVNISDLSVTVSGIHYNEARISMDKDIPTIPSPLPTETTPDPLTYSAKFQIMSGSMSLSSEEGSKSISRTQNIVLVPQNSSLPDATGLSIEIKFKKDNSEQYTTCTSTYYIDFKEGKKYSLSLNFIGDDVVLVNADPKAWDSKNVTHTFE